MYTKFGISLVVRVDDIITGDILSPPYGIGQAIIFLPCGFFFFLLSSFSLAYSQPLQIGYVYHTFKHGVALVRI